MAKKTALKDTCQILADLCEEHKRHNISLETSIEYRLKTVEARIDHLEKKVIKIEAENQGKS